MKKTILVLTSAILITGSTLGCLQPKSWENSTTVEKVEKPLQLTEQEWLAAKEFKTDIAPAVVNTTKDQLRSVYGILYGIAEVLKSDSTLKYNVQVDDFRLKAIETRYNGKSITEIIPDFVSKVSGKFSFLSEGDKPLTDENRAKAISVFKTLAGGIYLVAEGE